MKLQATFLFGLVAGVMGCSATGSGAARSSGAVSPAAGAGSTGVAAASTAVVTNAPPGRRVGLWDLDGLVAVKARVKAGDATLKPAVDRAVKSADRWLALGPWSVVDKTRSPPSNDKHDYMSLATYWWPDPAKPDGLPYVRRDGNVNPERNTEAFDHVRLNNLSEAVIALGLGYYLTEDGKYAEHAAMLIRTWFLEGKTRMNPNLNYAQGVPGVTTGRAEGVIDTMRLARLLDAVELLRGAAAWTPADEMALKTWFTQMLEWLRTSKEAKKEESAANNHGTWYDVQVARYAVFVDKPELVKALAESAKQRRIAVQVEPDGSQPKELARTKTFDYSMFNLLGMFDLATLARGVGVDLFAYATSDGRSIRKALEYMLPYADPAKKWPGTQISPAKHDEFVELLRRAGMAYHEPAYEQALQTHFHGTADADIVQIVYPKR
jgi:hypothetical protein